MHSRPAVSSDSREEGQSDAELIQKLSTRGGEIGTLRDQFTPANILQIIVQSPSALSAIPAI